jgi:cytochrome P450
LVVEEQKSAWIDITGPIFTKRLLQDPYAYYRALRSEAPVHYDRHSGEVILTRYRDVVTALKDPRLSSRRVVETGIPVPNFFLWAMRPVSGLLARQMLFSDPPDHTRLRGLANRAFTPRAVQVMRPTVERIADELLQRVDDSPEVDLIRDYAVWLPLLVIAEMLGVPTQHRAAFKVWSDDLALFIGGSTRPLPVVLSRAARGVFQLRRYFRGLLRQRRRSAPVDDLLGALIAVEEKGDTLTEDELLANAILLLAAGHETTTNLIGNGMLALLRHPDQLQLLRTQRELMGSAVEELLRYESPVQWTGRVTLEPVEIDGYRVAAGQTVAIGVGAANRDPAQFTEPDRLDVRRRDNSHLAFGHGIHFCLGSALARLEGEVALGALLDHYPEIRLADGPIHWHENFTLRGLKSLPVRVG